LHKYVCQFSFRGHDVWVFVALARVSVAVALLITLLI